MFDEPEKCIRDDVWIREDCRALVREAHGAGDESADHVGESQPVRIRRERRARCPVTALLRAISQEQQEEREDGRRRSDRLPRRPGRAERGAGELADEVDGPQSCVCERSQVVPGRRGPGVLDAPHLARRALLALAGGVRLPLLPHVLALFQLDTRADYGAPPGPGPDNLDDVDVQRLEAPQQRLEELAP